MSLRNYNIDRYSALFAGISISGVSAWYSIVGLTAIFSAAFWSIVIMGSVLEIGKIITASYLYRNWEKMPIIIKTYFTTAVVILMLITSMGTFGYLSKAHIEQASSVGDSQERVERIDSTISREKEKIARADAALKQLDGAINSMISNDRATRGLEYRRIQEKERATLKNEIKIAQANIDELLDEKVPLSKEIRNLQREVGPIRYVALMIYGDDNEEILERTIRWVIILLVLVLDPLAILLIMITTKNNLSEWQPKSHPTYSERNKYTKEEMGWLKENSNAVATDGESWIDIPVVVKKKKNK